MQCGVGLPHPPVALATTPCAARPGLTLWSISKTFRLPQQYCDELWAALQGEVTRRLSTATHAAYMTGAAAGLARQGGRWVHSVWGTRHAAGACRTVPPRPPCLPSLPALRQDVQLWPAVPVQHRLLCCIHGTQARLRPAACCGPRRGLGGRRIQASGAAAGWAGLRMCGAATRLRTNAATAFGATAHTPRVASTLRRRPLPPPPPPPPKKKTNLGRRRVWRTSCGGWARWGLR